MENSRSNNQTSEAHGEYGPIEKLHREKVSGKVSDKWASYLKVYDQLFAPLEKRKIRLFEIGVQNGGSLELWSKFFKDAEIFVGCDINPQCKKLAYSDPRIHVVVGDANDSQTYGRIQQISDRFDVVIDDGSHVSDDILNSFNLYFPLLKPGGIFVIEDTHTLYGRKLKRKSAVNFFKGFADLVNYEFWSGHSTVEKLLGGYASASKLPEDVKAGWVEAVEFRNSMIIIRKELAPTHSKLGPRIVVGTEAVVDDGPLNVKTAPVHEEGQVRRSWNPRTWF